MPPVAIRKVTNAQGKVICQFTPPGQDSKGVQPCQADPAPDTGKQVITPQHAYLITSILSDKRARCPAFGCPNVLELPYRPVAAKTGTTNDYKDNWTLGYTPDLVVGVWVGNADNTPMKGTTGVTGAAPIWHDFHGQGHPGDAGQRILTGQPGIVEKEICADTGTVAERVLPAERRKTSLPKTRLPLGPEPDPHRPQCPDAPPGVALFGYPGADRSCARGPRHRKGKSGRRRSGVTLVPMDCSSAPGVAVGPVVISITSPAEGATVAGQRRHHRHGVRRARSLRGDVGARPGGGKWEWISGPHLTPVENGPLTEWNVDGLEPGEYTLRIVAYARQGGTTEARVHIRK